MKEQMLEFGPGILLEVFAETYAYEHGEKKIQDVANKIESSKKMNTLLEFSISNSQFPSSTIILNYLNSMIYFAFSKSETLCLGAMYFVNLCSAKMRIFDKTGTDEFLLKNEKDEIKLLVELLLNCNKMKISKQGFFNKFFQSLAEISKQDINAIYQDEIMKTYDLNDDQFKSLNEL